MPLRSKGRVCQVKCVSFFVMTGFIGHHFCLIQSNCMLHFPTAMFIGINGHDSLPDGRHLGRPYAAKGS